MCPSWWLLLAVVSLRRPFTLGQNTDCTQGTSDAGDPCLFDCHFGVEREVSLELERLSHENSHCRLNGVIVYLMSSIHFTNRTMASRWFTGDLTVIGLEIDMHNIDTIQSFAFDADAFCTIVKLTLKRMHVASGLQPRTFERLHVLRELYFYELLTVAFIPKWLASVGPTLERLLVYGPAKPSFDLNGLTADAPMQALRSIHYSLNLNGSIHRHTFHGLTAVETLELTGCSIEHIGPGAFDTLGDRLQLLKLNQNRLRQLPVGLFDRLLPANADHQLTIVLDGNPWNCRCDLVYVQKVLRSHRANFHGAPVCAAPVNIAGEQITELCVNGSEVVFHKQLRCMVGEFMARDEEKPVSIAFRQNHFKLLSLPGNRLDVWRVLPAMSPWLLVRLSVAGFTMQSFVGNAHTTTEDMDCVWGLSMRHRMPTPLAVNRAHVLCVLDKDTLTLSPLDCTTFFQRSNVVRKPLWLSSTLKPTVATTLAIVLVGCVCTGALTVYAVFSILRRPMKSAQMYSAPRADPIYNDPDCYLYAELSDEWTATEASTTTSISMSRRLSDRCHSEIHVPLTAERRRVQCGSTATATYLHTIRRTESDPTLVYQSSFDVVPAARCNSVVYV